MSKRLVFAIVAACGLIAVVLLSGPLTVNRNDASIASYRLELPDQHGEEADALTHPTSGAMAAMQWLARQRAYPADRYPETGWLEGWETSRGLRETKRQAVSPWESIGPSNIGGRTLALAFNPQNPQTLWAGSASGGLWRSRTAGVGTAAWQRVETGYPVLGVSAIAIDPADSNVMYIGTGEVYSYDDTQGGIAVRLTRGSFGIGVLKSLDGGATWFKSLDWSYDQGRGVQVVKLDPDNPDIVWAGTSDGLYKTVDAGANWYRVHDVVMTTDLLIHAADTDVVVAACGNLGSAGRGLYRTDDGGQSWTQLWNPDVIPDYQGMAQLAASASDPDVFVASIGNGGSGSNATWLIRSEDAGLTWSSVSTYDYSLWQGWFSHDVAIHPADPWHVLTIGIDIHHLLGHGPGMETLSDWGASYFGQVPVGGPEGPADYSHADHHDILWHPTDPDVIYFANDGGVFRTTDGGLSFEGCNGGYQTTQFYAGFSSSSDDMRHALGGMQDNYSAIFDGSDAWIRVVGGDGSWTAIDPTNEDIIYASAQYLYLFKSYTRGQSWSVITPNPMVGAPGFIAPYALAGPDNPQIIYAGTTYLLRSLNGGSTWQSTRWLGGNPALALAVSPADDQRLAITTAPVNYHARVYVSDNGGVTVTDVTGDLPDRYPVGLAFAPDDPDVFYVTFSGFGTGHVYGTENGGQTWDDLTGDLPDLPTSSVVVDPFFPDHVYVGNDLGVYVSTDRGQTWEAFADGLPEAVVCMDLTTCDRERLLRVSTYGNGVWEREMVPGAPLAVEEPTPTADLLRVSQNAPNPFNPRTSIPFVLAREARVDAEVLTVRGERVTTLMREVRPGGDHVIHWDGTAADGRPAPAGIYLCRIAADDAAAVVKMQLVR